MMNEDITKEMLENYEKIRMSGRYNMFTDGSEVMDLIGCDDSKTYLHLLKNYSYLCNKFGVKIG